MNTENSFKTTRQKVVSLFERISKLEKEMKEVHRWQNSVRLDVHRWLFDERPTECPNGHDTVSGCTHVEPELHANHRDDLEKP